MLPTGHREPSTSPAGPIIGHSGPIFSPPAHPSHVPFSLLPSLTEDICMSAASPASPATAPHHLLLRLSPHLKPSIHMQRPVY